MNDILLTVSGVIPEDVEAQIERGERPLADYVAMRRGFPADVLDYRAARQHAGWFGRLIERLAGANALLAWVCFNLRKHYRVIFTDGEQVGLPLALLFWLLDRKQRPRHLMIVHILSVPKKLLLMDRFGLQRFIDVFFTYSTWQQRFIQQRWKLPPERVVFTPFMVDADFFCPQAADGELPAGLVLDFGIELQGYVELITPMTGEQAKLRRVRIRFGESVSEAMSRMSSESWKAEPTTLLRAVEGLPVRVVIAAASPWSKREDTTAGRTIPENVVVQRFSQFELRRLYACSRFLVMPLYNVEFQAGVTALLEAMAMERAVICTRTPGQTDVVVEGVTGVYVPPGDAGALRAAIQGWLERPEEAERMGKAGRERIEAEMNLERYVDRFKQYL